jgi:hypothetical protein
MRLALAMDEGHMPKAKATRRSAVSSNTPAAPRTARTKQPRENSQDPLVKAAASVGATLGRLAGRMDTLDKQRAQLIAEVQRVVAQGQELLKRLGHTDTAGDEETAQHEPVVPPSITAPSHRMQPTARHDASVLAKAQHAAERIRPRTAFRSQNR